MESSRSQQENDEAAGCLVVENKNANIDLESGGDGASGSNVSIIETSLARKKKKTGQAIAGKSVKSNRGRGKSGSSSCIHENRDDEESDASKRYNKSGNGSGNSNHKHHSNQGNKQSSSSEGHKNLSQLDASLLQEPLIIRTHSSYQVRSEQKATHVLGLVFAVFVICWTPFFILNFLSGIMPHLQVPPMLSITFLWLGYVSSTMNPVIYTIFNRNFRTAFKKILLCQSFSVTAAAAAAAAAKSANKHSLNRRKRNNTNSAPAFRTSPNASRTDFSANFDTA